MLIANSKDILKLKKAKRFIAMVIALVERDSPSVEIRQQIMMAIGLIRSARQLYVRNYLEECLRTVARTKSPKERTVLFEEIVNVTKAYNK